MHVFRKLFPIYRSKILLNTIDKLYYKNETNLKPKKKKLKPEQTIIITGRKKNNYERTKQEQTK